MEELLPELQITLPEVESELGCRIRSSSSSLKGEKTGPFFLDPCPLFSFSPQSIWLEIGFGGGEHLAAQAERNPGMGFIGCEPFVNGIASLLDHTDRKKLRNIRIFPGDARLLLDALPDASLARAFLLFPDPWPKARHAERRFIGPQSLPRLARVLKKGAELRLATDDEQLKEWMRENMRRAEEFELVSDSAVRPEDWVPTRYEEKALKAGRKPCFGRYRRR